MTPGNVICHQDAPNPEADKIIGGLRSAEGSQRMMMYTLRASRMATQTAKAAIKSFPIHCKRRGGRKVAA